MSNLIDIQTQIEKLQKQAESLKAKEFNNTVVEIRAKMKAFGITIKDIIGKSPNKIKGVKTSKVAKTKKTRKSKTAGVPVAAKYKGPQGETWSGRGLTPKWLTTLIAQGRKKEEFAI
ncbi:MAG TPA: H-NS histone family protein [Burkholderiaceae bacterium]|nr:H-NS histone family protein [Burkholderiaceae bacterium]